MKSPRKTQSSTVTLPSGSNGIVFFYVSIIPLYGSLLMGEDYSRFIGFIPFQNQNVKPCLNLIHTQLENK